jgi:hypothetical protein
MISRGRQIIWLSVILLLSIVALALAPPIPQPQSYHDFADQRRMLGIPNFLNVLSNLPFLLAGVAGLIRGARHGTLTAPRSWCWFFAAFTLVGAGSSYYHWAPSDATLVWDRLPMALAFMSLFSAILNDSLWPGSERRLLPLLLMLGAASVIWWDYSGDLRLYGWVQFAPLLFIAFLAKFNGFRSIRRGSLGAAFIAYILAKVFEALDPQIYEWSLGLLSGHSLKHLSAALSGYILYRMLRRMEPVAR